MGCGSSYFPDNAYVEVITNQKNEEKKEDNKNNVNKSFHSIIEIPIKKEENNDMFCKIISDSDNEGKEEEDEIKPKDDNNKKKKKNKQTKDKNNQKENTENTEKTEKTEKSEVSESKMNKEVSKKKKGKNKNKNKKEIKEEVEQQTIKEEEEEEQENKEEKNEEEESENDEKEEIEKNNDKGNDTDEDDSDKNNISENDSKIKGESGYESEEDINSRKEKNYIDKNKRKVLIKEKSKDKQKERNNKNIGNKNKPCLIKIKPTKLKIDNKISKNYKDKVIEKEKDKNKETDQEDTNKKDNEIDKDINKDKIAFKETFKVDNKCIDKETDSDKIIEDDIDTNILRKKNTNSINPNQEITGNFQLRSNSTTSAKDKEESALQYYPNNYNSYNNNNNLQIDKIDSNKYIIKTNNISSTLSTILNNEMKYSSNTQRNIPNKSTVTNNEKDNCTNTINNLNFLNNSNSNNYYPYKENQINSLVSNSNFIDDPNNSNVNDNQTAKDETIDRDIISNPFTILNTNFLCSQTIHAHTQPVTVIIQIANGSILSGSLDKTIKVWSEVTDVPDVPKSSTTSPLFIHQVTLHGHKAGVTSLKEIQSDSLLVSGSIDCTIILWDLSTLNCIQILQGHKNSVLCLEIYEESGLIFSGGKDKLIFAWSVDEGISICTIKGHDNCIGCLLYIEKFNYLCSGSDDMSIKIWNASENFIFFGSIDNLKSEINCLRYSKNRLLVACQNGVVYFINIKTLEKLRSVQFTCKPVFDFFIMNKEFLVTGNGDGKGRIWKIGSDERCVLDGHSKEINSIILLADKRIASCSSDNTIKIWEKEKINQ